MKLPDSLRPVHLKWNLVALVMAFLAMGCTSEPWGCGMGAACPAMADVQGARYAVSGPVDLVGIDGHVAPFAEISQSNTIEAFADNTALAVDGIDPRVLLVVRNRASAEDPGAFRELWSLADDPFPAEFCRYMPPVRQGAHPDCAGATSS